MTIINIGSDIVGHEGSKPTQAAERDDSKQLVVQDVARVERADRIDISVEGRALAAANAAGASPERLEQIRERLASGYYDASQVADEVARGLLASGDLE